MKSRLPLAGICMCAGIIGVLVTASGAQAGAFTVRSQTATGFGMALAGVAAGDEVSYSFWNPAVLANVEGFEIEAGGALVLPSIDISPDAATNSLIGTLGGTPSSTVDIGSGALVPASFGAIQMTERLTLGLALTSPFGLATESPADWAGQIYSRSSEMFSLNINPMASYRLNDVISIGVGGQIQYFSADLTQATALTPSAPDATLEANDIGVGFNLGIQIHPWEGTSVGLGYRSSISHDLTGSLEIAANRTSARATLDTPEIVSLGFNQDITDRFRAAGTVEWNNWSRLGNLAVVDRTGANLTTLHLDYRDGWLFSLGAEYDWSDRITVRGGIGYEIVPLTTDNRDTRLPEVDQLILSAGLSYKCSDSVTFAMSYLYSMGVEDGDVAISPGNDRYLGVPFTGTSDLDVSIISMGLNVKLGR